MNSELFKQMLRRKESLYLQRKWSNLIDTLNYWLNGMKK